MYELALYSSDFSIIKNSISKVNVFNIVNGVDRILVPKYILALHYFNQKRVKYIYYGNSFCQYKLPNLQELKKMVDFCNNNKLKLVLVTPPLTSYGIKLCKKFLEYFISINANYEIVINDFGMISLINELQYNGNIILGRLLDKTVRDYRFTDLEEQNYYTQNGFEYFTSLSSTSNSFSDLLFDNNIQRIEYDCSQHTFNDNPAFKYDYIFPTEYITTGRICMFKLSEQNETNMFELNDVCAKYCNKTIQLLSQPVNYCKSNLSGERIRNMDTIRYGNTIFNINNKMNISQYVDRVVLDVDMLSSFDN